MIEEKRRAIFLEIEDKARRWLRIRAGIIATEFALRNYRDNHKSSMLAKTSDAFVTITRGAYSGLTTQADGAGEILYGMPTDGGGARKADELSKGTQFQLYLALRIAGYREYASLRDPPSGVPFVADDIMEPFDDDRSEEAFGLLAKMAEVGQVIYLTHHQHLCAIAQKVYPNVRVHRLLKFYSLSALAVAPRRDRGRPPTSGRGALSRLSNFAACGPGCVKACLWRRVAASGECLLVSLECTAAQMSLIYLTLHVP